MEVKENSLTIQQYKSGKFITPYETFEIKLNGLPFKVNSIKIDNELVQIDKIKNNSFIVSKEFSTIIFQ